MKYLFAFALAGSLLLSSCIETPNTYSQMPPGTWRGILKLTDPLQAPTPADFGEEVKITDYFELPFNMEVAYDAAGKMQVFLINGAEKIPIENVHYGRDRSTAKDTLYLGMTAFDTYMDGFYEENTMEGYWHVNYKNNYQIPYIITYGQSHRFIQDPVANSQDFSGDWKMVFDYDKVPYVGIGEFVQAENELTGTIRTETGDYRFLAGNAYGDKLRLSVFDGAHAFLFSGSMDTDTIYGEFRSGKHYLSNWYAVRDTAFRLQNANEMTKATQAGPVDFTFKKSDGTAYTLSEKNSEETGITIINIMGTWCPNCKDEIAYLKELKSNPKYEDVKVVSLAFERYKDEAKALAMLGKYREVMGFDWPILLGGYADKKQNSIDLDFIDELYSYPTMIVLDRNRKIRKIHTGFSGPATSKYEEFKKEMATILNKLLAE